MTVQELIYRLQRQPPNNRVMDGDDVDITFVKSDPEESVTFLLFQAPPPRQLEGRIIGRPQPQASSSTRIPNDFLDQVQKEAAERLRKQVAEMFRSRPESYQR